MDTQQMFQELDRLYAQGKLDEAEEKMMGWMKEGLDSGNKSLCLMMCNEMEGLYRNTGRVAQAVDMADMALSLIAGMGLDGSIHHGTTLLNAATARRMAGDVEKALSQYREAEAIFKNLGKTDGYEMASLYNNISQIYQEQEEHEKALESLDKALELIKKMENSEAEVATTHVNRALSLMALGRLDEADEELKESLTFYASPEGVQSGHFGSALAAAGELAWRRGNYDQAIGLLEKALMVTQSRFGESDACAVIRQNLEMIKKEKEEKGITGAAPRAENAAAAGDSGWQRRFGAPDAGGDHPLRRGSARRLSALPVPRGRILRADSPARRAHHDSGRQLQYAARHPPSCGFDALPAD